MNPATLPHTAMVFAAGLGTRMRAHAPELPKPLVRVAGRALIDHTLDKLAAAGITRAVVNVAYRAEQIKVHLTGRSDIAIVFSEEGEEPLETGGGIRHALPLLGAAPFFVINSDIIWRDGASPALHRLAAAFDPARHDAMLLVCPLAQCHGYHGKGDFHMEAATGRLRRPQDEECAEVVYTGVQIMHPRLFHEGGLFYGRRERVFSLSELFRQACTSEGWLPRLGGVIHDAAWLHIGDGDGVRAAEAYLRTAAAAAFTL